MGDGQVADAVGQTNVGGGHWLREDISKFDAGLFGINPVEANVSLERCLCERGVGAKAARMRE
jgi:hypothetical protein